MHCVPAARRKQKPSRCHAGALRAVRARAAATKAWPRGDPGASTHPQPHGSCLTSDLAGSTETDEKVDAKMAEPRPADRGWSESGCPRGARAPGPCDCVRTHADREAAHAPLLQNRCDWHPSQSGASLGHLLGRKAHFLNNNDNDWHLKGLLSDFRAPQGE